MKAKELKIGDWVYAKNPITCEDMPCKIEEISKDKASAGMAWWYYDDLSPIPLTEEILEKNGWHNYYDNELTNPNFAQIHATFSIEENEWYIIARQDASGDTFLANIKYVHELQHILWALKIDDSLNI